MKLPAAKTLKLRETFAAHTRPDGAIRDVLMVGALSHGQDTISFNDKAFLRAATYALKKTALALAPDFTVSVNNLAREEGGEDFLKTPQKADLVVLSFLFNPQSRIEAETLATVWRAPQCRVSERHFDAGIWYDAVKATQTKAVYVAGGPHLEVNETHLLRENGAFAPVEDTRLTIGKNYGIGSEKAETMGVLLLRR